MRASQLEIKRLKLMEHYGFGPDAMKKIKICRNCGMTFPVQETICGTCGEKLPIENVYQQYKKRQSTCPECGTIVSSKKRFCPQCGKQLIKDQIVYKAINL